MSQSRIVLIQILPVDLYNQHEYRLLISALKPPQMMRESSEDVACSPTRHHWSPIELDHMNDLVPGQAHLLICGPCGPRSMKVELSICGDITWAGAPKMFTICPSHEVF